MDADQAIQVRVPEDAHASRFQRGREMIRSAAGEQGGFAEEVAGAEHPEDLLAPIGVDPGDLQCAGVHHHQLRAIRSRCIDRVPPIETGRARHARHVALVGGGQRLEQRNPGDAQVLAVMSGGRVVIVVLVAVIVATGVGSAMRRHSLTTSSRAGGYPT